MRKSLLIAVAVSQIIIVVQFYTIHAQRRSIKTLLDDQELLISSNKDAVDWGDYLFDLLMKMCQSQHDNPTNKPPKT